MLTKFIGGVSVAMIGAMSMLWVQPAAAWPTIKLKSVECTQLVPGGTNLNQKEQAFLCAMNLKEISTKCVNKGGNADNSNSHIFAVRGTAIKLSTSDAFIKQKNGTSTASVTFEDEDIKLMVDKWNSVSGEDPIVLGSGSGLCPNRNYTLTWAATRFDLVATTVLRPKGGSSVYECVDTVYNLLDGTQVTDCVPIKQPFRSCQRSVSGIQFKDANGTSVDNDPNLARIQECILFRDVNKDANFSLASVGTYNPDVNHLSLPFDGLADGGGVWLTDGNFTKGTYYTGTCHQHGKENGNGVFSQSGPNSPTYDVVTGAIVPGTGDVDCTGGSQLLNRTN